jgi:hypothetical protein
LSGSNERKAPEQHDGADDAAHNQPSLRNGQGGYFSLGTIAFATVIVFGLIADAVLPIGMLI